MTTAHSQPNPARTLLPRPVSITASTGEFTLDASTRISAPAALGGVVAWLQGALRPATGLPLRDSVVEEGGAGSSEGSGDASGEVSDVSAGTIVLALSASLPAEAYRLTVSTAGIRVDGGDAAGVFYGCQALRQLLPSEIYRSAPVSGVTWSIAGVRVEDAPRFAWRGAMLDVARHFMPKHNVLRFIDLIALHRLNTLHLHLTDDQGWRIEIKRYPKLTSVGGWRHESQVGAGPEAGTDGRPHGGYYTQDDIREIVAYAAARFVTVVPEIESPGHVHAAIAAYPELGVSGEPVEVFTRWGIDPTVLRINDATVSFFTNVLDEVMELFPSPYIGVGGDECPKDQWRSDAETQRLMGELGLADEEALQSWFIHRLDDHLTAAGRRLYGWDEILEGGLAPGATVASWRGWTGAIAAARTGHDVVVCPDDGVYLDYRQSDAPNEPIQVGFVLSVADVYNFEPVPAELTAEEARHVLGGQANIWSEHMDSPRTVDFFAFPRLCAVAEALWADSSRDFADFSVRLDEHLGRLDALGVEYHRHDGPLPWQERPGVAARPTTREARLAHLKAVTANIES
jgi:hexosaminidase